MTQVFGVVFYVVFSFNFCLKRNDDQPSPDTGVFCAYLGQVIGIEHQRVAGNETEWILVLLFGKHSVCGSQLLYNAGIEPGTFFELGCDKQPLSLGLSHLWFYIAFAVHGQGVG